MVVVLSGERWRYALGTLGRWTVWTKDGPAELSWVWLDYRQVSPDRAIISKSFAISMNKNFQ